jgi:hypothetical protein
MGYTIDSKNNQEILKKTIETNDRKDSPKGTAFHRNDSPKGTAFHRNDNSKMKNNSYENIKSIVSEQNAFKPKNNNPKNNTIKNKIEIGL